jgi:hypothetical protein
MSHPELLRALIAWRTYVIGLRLAAVLSHPASRSRGTNVGARKVRGTNRKVALSVVAAFPLTIAADNVSPEKPMPTSIARHKTTNCPL